MSHLVFRGLEKVMRMEIGLLLEIHGGKLEIEYSQGPLLAMKNQIGMTESEFFCELGYGEVVMKSLFLFFQFF